MRLNPFRQLLCTLLTLSLTAGVLARSAAAEDDPLALLTGEPEETVSTGHLARPVSKIAENLTVITSDDIRRLNAHTLADVLQTIPGIQLDYVRTPGSFSYFNIQGAFSTQVLVLIDGIPANTFDQNKADTGKIPVQQIERVEIVKGAASTAWGQALGGVVNVVTKSPNPDQRLGGLVSGSMGDRFTADTRGELSGTVDRFGYYLSTGNLHSDGLLANNGTNQNNLYAKIVYTLPSQGEATLGFSYMGVRGGMEEGLWHGWLPVHDTEEKRRTYGFLRLIQPFGDRLQLEATGYTTSRDEHTRLGEFANGDLLLDNDFNNRESSRGVNARLTWGDNSYNLVTGLEYEHASARTIDLVNANTLYDRNWDHWALYANGTVSIGRLAILPGLRYDHTGISSEYLSSTLGATYQLADTTVLRAYAAQGYALPNPQFQHGLQRTRTVQAGIESSAIPWIWLKGTYFYNDLSGVEYVNDATLHNQTKQGFELEARTSPLYGVSLTGGYTYLIARDKDSGLQLQTNSGQAVPPQSLKLALRYDNDRLGLKGTMVGNYVWWHEEERPPGRYKAMIWDLHLNWQVLPENELSPELFFSVHNLFNGVQTIDTELYTNTPRWFEGGLRVRF